MYNSFGILLSVLFLYFSFRSVGKAGWSQLFNVPHPWMLSIVVGLNVVLMALKTYLWQILLRPTMRLPFWTLFDILHLGYMANNLLPLKAGEFFRCSFVSKKWTLPYTRVLTTIGLERYFAGLSLLIILVVMTFWLDIPIWLRSGAYTLGVILFGVQVWMWILWAKKAKGEKPKPRNKILFHIFNFMDHVEHGSSVLKEPRYFFWLIIIGLATWFCQFTMLRIIETAYDLSLPWTSTMFVVIAVNLAIALPSAPANLGTFEFASILAYQFVGIGSATGLGIGLFFHFLQAIPVTLIGLFFYWRWGIRFKDIERDAEDRLEEAIT